MATRDPLRSGPPGTCWDPTEKLSCAAPSHPVPAELRSALLHRDPTGIPRD
ncbi:hypothetical protein A2U01_0058046 [Trifolium medium]|uniref:Uncharacterized protein n=1 Tax=Trifolium medium TaxID=97028 RepID=A0A392RJP9_9FABA|nr:hypothetical protein [Trifolium medium]